MAVSASLVNSLVRRWQESCDEKLRQMRAIQARMAAASSYSEWREFAQQLDAMGHCRGGDVSGKVRKNLYDRKLLQQKLAHLQSVREHGNGREMMFALRTDLIRNIANVAKRCEGQKEQQLQLYQSTGEGVAQQRQQQAQQYSSSVSSTAAVGGTAPHTWAQKSGVVGSATISNITACYLHDMQLAAAPDAGAEHLLLWWQPG
jgi:hypothetical protein